MTLPMLHRLSLTCAERQTTCYTFSNLSWLCHTLSNYVYSCLVSKLSHFRLPLTTFFGRFGGCQDAATLEFSIVLPTLTTFTIKCHTGSQTFSLVPLNLIPHLSRLSTSGPAIAPSLLRVSITCVRRTLRFIRLMTIFVQSSFGTFNWADLLSILQTFWTLFCIVCCDWLCCECVIMLVSCITYLILIVHLWCGKDIIVITNRWYCSYTS